MRLTVNGKPLNYEDDPEMPLLWYLRDDLRLTGTRFGCGAGLCGACTVHVNGQAVRSCQTSWMRNRTAGTGMATVTSGICRTNAAAMRRGIPATQSVCAAMAAAAAKLGTAIAMSRWRP